MRFLVLAASLASFALTAPVQHIHAFVQQHPPHYRAPFGIPKSTIRSQRSSRAASSSSFAEEDVTAVTTPASPATIKIGRDDSHSGQPGDEEDLSPWSPTSVIRCPLKFLGPYPAVALRFPHLATQSQRVRNATGVSLDFVVDTGANLNTLNGQVAKELSLEQVGEALPGVGAAGLMAGGHTYQLGDTELEGGQLAVVMSAVDDETEREGKNDEDRESTTFQSVKDFLFMQNLTASVMPVTSPGSAGLLSLAFLYCFEGGVEFNWGKLPESQLNGFSPKGNDDEVVMNDGLVATDKFQNGPSVTFYGEKDDAMAKNALEGMRRVRIKSIPVTQLPSIMVEINGVVMPALLDTGSPITVLNQQAAKQAGIETIEVPSQSQREKAFNPFAAVANKLKEAQAVANAAANGNLLTIGSMNGPVNLLRSTSPAEISVLGDSALTDDDEGGSSTISTISFGRGRVFVGDIPGLQALNGIGVDAPPAVVLGMDVLRQRPKMLLRAQDNEVYF